MLLSSSPPTTLFITLTTTAAKAQCKKNGMAATCSSFTAANTTNGSTASNGCLQQDIHDTNRQSTAYGYSSCATNACNSTTNSCRHPLNGNGRSTNVYSSSTSSPLTAAVNASSNDPSTVGFWQRRRREPGVIASISACSSPLLQRRQQMADCTVDDLFTVTSGGGINAVQSCIKKLTLSADLSTSNVNAFHSHHKQLLNDLAAVSTALKSYTLKSHKINNSNSNSSQTDAQIELVNPSIAHDTSVSVTPWCRSNVTSAASCLTRDHIVSASSTIDVTTDHVVTASSASDLTTDHVVTASSTSDLTTDHVVTVSSTSDLMTDYVITASSTSDLTTDHVVTASSTSDLMTDYVITASSTSDLMTDYVPSASSTSPINISQSTPNLFSLNTNGKRPVKRVAFADDRGFQLVTIRIMTEPSDVPPLLSATKYGSTLLGCGNVRFFSNNNNNNDDDEPPFDDPSNSKDDQSFFKENALDWTLNFKQPASDYLTFRHKVDNENVALENVIVKNERQSLIGTVKVKNLSFEKFVFVRCTCNNWRTFNDFPCKYKSHKTTIGSSSSSSSSSLANPCRSDLFDTFEFDIDLKSFLIDQSIIQRNDERTVVDTTTLRSKNIVERIEFCVCFKANNVEYWDNNNGSNYKLLNRNFAPNNDDCGSSKLKSANLASNPEIFSTNNNHTKIFFNSQCNGRRDDEQHKISPPRSPLFFFNGHHHQTIDRASHVTDAFMMNMPNWTQFASWTHLSTEGPYW